MTDTITKVPRLVRVSVAVALGVALPVAVLRAAPDRPGAPADSATDQLPASGANDLTVPGLSASEPPVATHGGGTIASADGIVAAALSTPFIPQAAVTAPVFGHTTSTAHTAATTTVTRGTTSHQSPTEQPDATEHESTSTSSAATEHEDDTTSPTTAKPAASTDSTEKADAAGGNDDATGTATDGTKTPTSQQDDDVAAEHLSMWKVPTVHDLVPPTHTATASTTDVD